MEISCVTKRPLSAYLVGYIASSAALSRTSLDSAAVRPGGSTPMIADNWMTDPSICIGSPSVCKNDLCNAQYRLLLRAAQRTRRWRPSRRCCR